MPENAVDANIGARYDRDGFVYPVPVMSASEAASCRASLEEAEATLLDRPDLLSKVRGSPHFVLPFVDDIMCHPSILDAVAAVLGPDLLVWGVGFFAKPARSASFVSWHQDLIYWGLDDIEEVTAWVAITPVTRANGCMRFVPGSHRREIVPHRDSFHDDNLLTRGQEIAVNVDEDKAVDVVLAAGEMSLHHGRMFHASGPNGSDDRRIGLAIRYITPRMRQTSGKRTMARLVRGDDRYGHFELMPPPRGLLDPADFDRMERARALQESILFAGAAKRRQSPV